MKLKAIKSQYLNHRGDCCKIGQAIITFIKEGKVYDTTETYRYNQSGIKIYPILCEDGRNRYLESRNFIPLSEWREMKLKELGL